MTALQLLGYICAVLIAQLSGAAAFAWRRHRLAASREPDHQPSSARTHSAAWQGWRNFRVARREFEDAANSQCSFYLEPVDGAPLPAFKPGQFLTVGIHAGTEGLITRCYSISDAPDARGYRITIKRAAIQPNAGPPRRAASCHFHDDVAVGDVVKVRAPAGQFCIEGDGTAEPVFIAGGIGITPVLSMLLSMLSERPERKAHLYYGVRNGAEQAFKAQLSRLASLHRNFRLHVAYSQPRPGDERGRDFQHSGYLSVDVLRSTLPHGVHEFYVCGPPAMMQSVIPALKAWGVDGNNIHYEAFGPASGNAALGESKKESLDSKLSVEVQFRRAGRTLKWDGRDESLLTFAERHGIAVDFGCRSGSCGSCETGLIAGTVRYAHPPEFDASAGHCLMCVAVPTSALVLDA